MRVKRGLLKNPRKSRSLQTVIDDNFAPRTTQSRAYFIERLEANEFKRGQMDFSGRTWWKNEESAVAIGENIKPHGVTVISLVTKYTRKFNDYGNAWAYLRQNKLIGLK